MGNEDYADVSAKWEKNVINGVEIPALDEEQQYDWK